MCTKCVPEMCTFLMYLCVRMCTNVFLGCVPRNVFLGCVPGNVFLGMCSWDVYLEMCTKCVPRMCS